MNDVENLNIVENNSQKPKKVKPKVASNGSSVMGVVFPFLILFFGMFLGYYFKPEIGKVVNKASEFTYDLVGKDLPRGSSQGPSLEVAYKPVSKEDISSTLNLMRRQAMIIAEKLERVDKDCKMEMRVYSNLINIDKFPKESEECQRCLSRAKGLEKVKSSLEKQYEEFNSTCIQLQKGLDKMSLKGYNPDMNSEIQAALKRSKVLAEDAKTMDHLFDSSSGTINHRNP